jgi:tetratricopeptide (TPR) repeat protein
MRLRTSWTRGAVAAVAIALAAPPVAVATQGQDRERVVRIVEEIRRADYEADLAALRRLYEELEPLARGPAASRVRYWRGFALWRRAMNAMNAPETDLAAIRLDLQSAVDELTRAFEADPDFADAEIAASGCLMSLTFVLRTQGESESAEPLVHRFVELLQEAHATAPDNPRVLWVAGGSAWWAPPEHGGSQTRAIELYERGLAAARREKPPTDPLEPSWGEPELLMSLAWASLNREEPDLAAAERYARAALELVPRWHYVREILLEQILEAQAKP